MTRTLKTILASALVAAALATALTMPASADLANVTVRMPDGTIQAMTIDVPAGATLQDISSLVPGEPVGYEIVAQDEPEPAPVPEPAPPAEPAPVEVAPQAAPEPQPTTPAETTVSAPSAQPPAPGETPALDQQPLVGEQPLESQPLEELEGSLPLREPRRRAERIRELLVEVPARDDGTDRDPRPDCETMRDRPDIVSSPMRADDGSPTRANPGLTEALPGPAFTTGVPNFVIEKFRVPVFLLPIYQAAGIEYGIRWEILAAINEIETDYGRNLNVSSAGRLGGCSSSPPAGVRMGSTRTRTGARTSPPHPRQAAPVRPPEHAAGPRVGRHGAAARHG